MGVFMCCECDEPKCSHDGYTHCKEHNGGICPRCSENMSEEEYERKTGEKL